MARHRLRDDVALDVVYEDGAEFGSPLTTKPLEGMRRLFAPVLDHLERRGLDETLQAGPRLIEQVVTSRDFSQVAVTRQDGTWELHPSVCFPDAARTRPRWLVFRTPGESGPLRLMLDDADWAWVHDLVAKLSVSGVDDSGPHLDVNKRTVLDSLRAFEMLDEPVVDVDDDQTGLPTGRPSITFVGHNTVVVQSQRSRVIVDPLFFAATPDNPSTYQPLTPADIGSVDAVLVTHSHPDHFDPASLLRFPARTPVVVPRVERESLLCVDMALRLGELGFTDVRQLAWGSSISIGDVEVNALPFYGEQPSIGEVLHPEVRNWGCTYVVATPTFTVALLADAGRDHLGDIGDVAASWSERAGPVDVVFSGYRGWETQPVQLLFSSVAPYLLFVPPSIWGVRQRLMNNAVDAADVAGRMGARYLVPYADGGAPWHWDAGLGPRLDGHGVEDVDFDPFPHRVVDAVRARAHTTSGTALEALLLHPGDTLVDVAATPRVATIDGHAWPYGT
jgi:L-ascorbate metabolism protein UlaG (beta-lactamase superfamily)